jgi:hypothetical protein
MWQHFQNSGYLWEGKYWKSMTMVLYQGLVPFYFFKSSSEAQYKHSLNLGCVHYFPYVWVFKISRLEREMENTSRAKMT